MNELKEIEILSEMDKVRRNKLIRFIIFKILQETGYTTIELSSRNRARAIVEARQLSMYFMNLHTKYSLRLVGGIYNRIHGTVLHANKTINNLADTEKRIREITDRINADIKRFKIIQKAEEIKNKEREEKEYLKTLNLTK